MKQIFLTVHDGSFLLSQTFLGQPVIPWDLLLDDSKARRVDDENELGQSDITQTEPCIGMSDGESVATVNPSSLGSLC